VLAPASTQNARPDFHGTEQWLRRTAWLVGLGIFVSTFAQTGVLGRLPFEFLLKGRLHAAPEALAGFFALATLPWNFKPLAGLLSDSTPIFGTRRKHYLLLSAAAAAGLWCLLGAVSVQFSLLVAVAIGLNVALMIISTATGGVLVEAGKEYRASGRLTSLRFLVMNVATLIAGPLGGFLAAQAFGMTAITGAVLCLSLIPATLWLLKEPPTARRNASAWVTARAQLKELLRSGTVWSAAGMLFLVQLAPGFTTPLFYYQTDTLHFSPEYIGDLALASSLFGIGAALVYARVCKHVALRTLLVLAIAASVVSTLFYLGYDSWVSALTIESLAGFVGTLAQLPLFDLAVRATPRGSEAFGYSLMMSVWNIGMSLSDVFGSWLFAHYRLNFMNLVWLNAGTTALALLAIPFLPARIVKQREEDRSATT
jgi:predicted MFS family arabinose efflux permease